MNKQELRDKLTALGVTFTEGDGIDVLKQKLQQVKSLAKKDTALPYVVMDAEDEQQILAELGGAVLDTYIYQFVNKGVTIVGLSKAGVDQVCRESANARGEAYRVIKHDIKEEGEYFYATVVAGRYMLLRDGEGRVDGREVLIDSAIGAKRQWKKTRSRDGRISDNPFAYEVALSKAQRNAKKALLPYGFIEEMIKKFKQLKGGKVKVIRGNEKIGDPHLKTLHGLGAELGLTHSKMKEIVKEAYGYESLNDIEISQMREVMVLLKEKAPKPVTMPSELEELFRTKGYMRAKMLQCWNYALDQVGGDTAKALAMCKEKMTEV